jgi:hypothetical protein
MKKLILIFIILLVPLVLAGNYGEGDYGEGIYVGGEITETPTPDPETPSGGGSSGGSGGSVTRSPTCSYDWQCTNWFPSTCPESGIQERICANKGNCTGIEGIPEQTQTCEYLGPEEPLFDIYLTLPEDYKRICIGNKIKANIILENYGEVELLDAFMTYWIIDENNTLIAELKDTRAVEKETSFTIEMKIPEGANEGIYRLYAEITYDGNKTAVSGESFDVLPQEDCAFFNTFNWMYLVYIGGGIVGLLLLILIIKSLKKKKKRVLRDHRSRIKKNLQKIKDSK